MKLCRSNRDFSRVLSAFFIVCQFYPKVNVNINKWNQFSSLQSCLDAHQKADQRGGFRSLNSKVLFRISFHNEIEFFPYKKIHPLSHICGWKWFQKRICHKFVISVVLRINKATKTDTQRRREGEQQSPGLINGYLILENDFLCQFYRDFDHSAQITKNGTSFTCFANMQLSCWMSNYM